MESKKEVKRLLIESGNGNLYSDENYNIATKLTSLVENNDPMLSQHFKNLEGQREQYKHDLIVKNCKTPNQPIKL